MTYPNRNRSAEKKARKKRDTLLLLNLILLIFIVTGGIFLWKEYSNSQQEASKPESSQVSKASPSEEASQPSSSSQNKEEIKWVKQDKPVKLPILMYHAIHVMDPSEAANSGLIVDPETFESHLKALKEAGYYTLSPAEAYKALTENVLPENKKVVWLTFDDSLKDFYTQAYPILQKYQMKATNNVITGFVQAGREDILTLDEIKEMKKNGMSFEDHTVNHPDLSVSSADTQNSELQDSKEYLDRNLSQTTTTVAYPSGRYSETTLQLAEKLGYKMGLTTNNGLASLSDGLLSLNRVRVNPTTTAQSLLDEIAN
ncbi:MULTISPECIES: polysaccharide deacetylase family protein [Streptococcus]|uniref:polysaccharide deacetylase family protein n=1 Tax=Streptococcus TaxID=1301 RepID=UPI0008AD035C|nr:MULTISPECIES: polysaccharide deacetylase family protein [Streptococcus]MBZ2123428.1 polysaccharide deacetylase family protein [Streptococcus gordonii]MCY7134055.1 polysaccharide deacetylase family protein [Streptococcus gordonii]OFL20893.1 deacetylase [Streptococcus sp. HMSC062B01]WAM21846.1 polysaccharide deacetylase family protein [Streptococcus gordonii]